VILDWSLIYLILPYKIFYTTFKIIYRHHWYRKSNTENCHCIRTWYDFTLRSHLYLVSDYLAVMWEGSICIARIITSDKSRTSSAILYTEDTYLHHW